MASTAKYHGPAGVRAAAHTAWAVARAWACSRLTSALRAAFGSPSSSTRGEGSRPHTVNGRGG